MFCWANGRCATWQQQRASSKAMLGPDICRFVRTDQGACTTRLPDETKSRDDVDWTTLATLDRKWLVKAALTQCSKSQQLLYILLPCSLWSPADLSLGLVEKGQTFSDGFLELHGGCGMRWLGSDCMCGSMWMWAMPPPFWPLDQFAWMADCRRSPPMPWPCTWTLIERWWTQTFKGLRH